MKKEIGITLTSLAIYITVMLIALAIIATITSYFKNNLEGADEGSVALAQYDKFNMYFLNEVKKTDIEIEEIAADETYIVFNNGNKYIYDQTSKTITLIKNEEEAEEENLIIANSIDNCTFEKDLKDGKTTIKVNIQIAGENRDTTYVLGY